MATCTMAIMDKSGDTKTTWDPERPDEVQAARTTFNTMKGKGYIAYRVDASGKPGAVMTEFDPRAGMVILTPPMRGG